MLLPCGGICLGVPSGRETFVFYRALDTCGTGFCDRIHYPFLLDCLGMAYSPLGLAWRGGSVFAKPIFRRSVRVFQPRADGQADSSNILPGRNNKINHNRSVVYFNIPAI